MMPRRRSGRREPMIALINIVFLMLIFFLVAGTLAPPRDPDLSLVRTTDLPPEEPRDALVVHADGSLSWRGTEISGIEDYLAALDPEEADQLRLMPDREAPASLLIALARDLMAAGAGSVVLVTERQLR